MSPHTPERRANIAAARRRGEARREPERIAVFWSYVEKTDTCWLWKGPTKDRAGYGRFSFRNRPEQAHRIAYMLERGPIAPGMTLDHVVCNTPACVNPWHVEQATYRENVLRSSGPAAVNARKTHCVRGHAFTPENTRIDSGRFRRCRSCERERSAWARQHGVTCCSRDPLRREASLAASRQEEAQ